MNALIGKVKGQSIEKNRDGDNNVRMLEVEITDPDDIQTIQQVAWSGDDNAPNIDDTVVIIEVSKSYKIAIGIQDLIEPTVDSGERKIYSQDGNGNIKASIYLKKDGSIDIVGTGDISIQNDGGSFSLNNATGQFDVNGNMTVDA